VILCAVLAFFIAGFSDCWSCEPVLLAAIILLIWEAHPPR
jgi:hypothetical protein